MIGYLDDVIRPLGLILAKMSGYTKTFNYMNNRLKSFHIDVDKLFEMY